MSSKTEFNFRSAKSLFLEIAQLLKPPSGMAVNEVLDKYMKLQEGGDFDSSLTPYMIEPMNWLTDRETHMIVYVSPARGGKSLCLITGSTVYIMIEDPSDTIIYHMTEGTAKKYSKSVLARVFRNTKKLLSILPTNKNDDNVLLKLFKNAMMLAIANPAPTKTSSADYKYVLITDNDRTPQDNGEGNWLIQADKRNSTFGSSGKTIMESSPRFDLYDPDWKPDTPHEAPPVEGIVSWYNKGDRRMEYLTCPHCGTEFKLPADLSLFRLPTKEAILAELKTTTVTAMSKKYAVIYPPCCGAGIPQSEKFEIRKSAVWKKEFPDAPNNKIKSYWGNPYTITFQTWDGLIYNYINAVVHYDKTQDEGELKTSCNVDCGGVYTPITGTATISLTKLKERLTDYGDRTVPKGVVCLLAQIDTQKYRFVVSIIGVAKNNEAYLIDRFDIKQSIRERDGGGYLNVQPASYAEDWQKVRTEVMEKTYPVQDDGEDMGVLHTVCDMHGVDGATQNAYQFATTVSDRDFTLVRGERPNPNSNNPLYIVGKVDKKSNAGRRAKAIGTKYLRINTTLGKDIVTAQINREEAGNNYIHMSKHLPINVYEELTVEVRTSKGWDNPRDKRNEQFDLFVYFTAQLQYLQKDLYSPFSWDSPPLEFQRLTADTIDDKVASDYDRILDMRNMRR